MIFVTSAAIRGDKTVIFTVEVIRHVGYRLTVTVGRSVDVLYEGALSECLKRMASEIELFVLRD